MGRYFNVQVCAVEEFFWDSKEIINTCLLASTFLPAHANSECLVGVQVTKPNSKLRL